LGGLDLLLAAHAEAARRPNLAPTDDAGLLRLLEHPVALVPGSPENLKITRPEDLTLAEAILANREPMTRLRDDPTPSAPFRVGHGYDVHPFADGRRLYLGGVEFPDAPRGLLGHSDADVVLHAVCDALLGAAGMGDIGQLFPPSDMRHKDRRSTEFLAEVKNRLDEAGWQIGNLDITVLAETPKVGPKSGEIKAAIAVILGIMPEQIGLKATTNEGLGFVGRREGIAVHATALLVVRR
jgi:2-C-methyl-D-erythritol 2,4-cyclodiphosphate synthase